MKNLKLSLLILAVASFSLAANAQRTVDLFGGPRAIVLAAPQNFTNVGTATLTSTVTNAIIDIHGFDGVGVIDIMSVSNSTSATAGVAASLTVTLQTSDDATNWSNFTTLALANSTTLKYTNGFYGGTNLSASDVYLLPGTNTTPTAATAGWATSYLIPANFTAGGALTVSAGGTWSYGIVLQDSKRYLQTVWSVAGSNVVYSGGAVLHGARGGAP